MVTVREGSEKDQDLDGDPDDYSPEPPEEDASNRAEAEAPLLDTSDDDAIVDETDLDVDVISDSDKEVPEDDDK